MLERLRLRHIVGIVTSILLATALSSIPFSVYFNRPFDITVADAATVSVFFVFVLAFLMKHALQKGLRFKENFNLELARMRRIFHLTKNLGSTKTDKAFHQKSV